ncbi:hypothetical protein ACIQWA_25125 [Kitasatospora sp. NPDC098652]|uniref:hypothetical protein n=1 Tax=Kitasatospora sp. NPDC098652 TaxID=3364095 RepID=UPI0038222CF9
MAIEQPIPDELTVEDIVLVERDAWTRIRESGSVLEAPGHRIYALPFLGPVPTSGLAAPKLLRVESRTTFAKQTGTCASSWTAG